MYQSCAKLTNKRFRPKFNAATVSVAALFTFFKIKAKTYKVL